MNTDEDLTQGLIGADIDEAQKEPKIDSGSPSKLVGKKKGKKKKKKKSDSGEIYKETQSFEELVPESSM